VTSGSQLLTPKLGVNFFIASAPDPIIGEGRVCKEEAEYETGLPLARSKNTKFGQNEKLLRYEKRQN